jgi:hypothetical protein
VRLAVVRNGRFWFGLPPCRLRGVRVSFSGTRSLVVIRLLLCPSSVIETKQPALFDVTCIYFASLLRKRFPVQGGKTFVLSSLGCTLSNQRDSLLSF